jgi:hypothetical protein
MGQGDEDEAAAPLQTARARMNAAVPLAPSRAARLEKIERRLGR